MIITKRERHVLFSETNTSIPKACTLSRKNSDNCKSFDSTSQSEGSGGDVPHSINHSTFQLIDPLQKCSLNINRVTSDAVLRIVAESAACQDRNSAHLTPYHGARAPPINLEDYLQRIGQFTKCSPVCFVMAVAYMDALNQKDPHVIPCALTIHRLMLVGTLLANKLVDDKRYSNHFWARVGGISLQELNALELETLQRLDYRLVVAPEVVRMYLRQMQANVLTLGSEAGESHRESVGRKRRSITGASSGGGSSPAGSERRSFRRLSSMDSVAAGGVDVSMASGGGGTQRACSSGGHSMASVGIGGRSGDSEDEVEGGAEMTFSGSVEHKGRDNSVVMDVDQLAVSTGCGGSSQVTIDVDDVKPAVPESVVSGAGVMGVLVKGSSGECVENVSSGELLGGQTRHSVPSFRKVSWASGS
ncbi:hypothetical protein CEUSTIGMA_g4221.t1 [Chlamydomonas eustigma]|uniref:Cyclin n=1 Tax=Chlamydomonas eustigma TaxID=1157962 RepID=A0A250X147_9CHLO|nr:hypothetical protein CEUSTIGMA_g4221.t1 [Chlamydomonas eustigma]|eukprot:GAX76775.1 hypothetical protein CEUSTIGMA_g4221.t1 [Chlamydomonas eustigma]